MKKSSSSFSSNRTLYVGGSGPDNYTYIRDAVYDAEPGDTIFVFSGTYYEYNIAITKSINLIGEDKNTTIVDARKKEGSIFNIYNTNGVNISNFKLLNSSSSLTYSSIRINSNYVIIYNNIISSPNSNGILVYDRKHDIIIKNNEISKCDIGIYFYYESHDNEILDNIIYDCNYGIYPCTANSKFIGNTIRNNKYGFFLAFFNDNIVRNNRLVDNSEAAMRLSSYVYNNFIFENNVENNNKGLHLTVDADSPYDNYIYFNNITNNIEGLKIYSSFDHSVNNNHFYGNNFIGNRLFNVQYIGTVAENSWNTNNFGNYWDDYTGYDYNGDGIGDSPYFIKTSNIDNYPLMEPYYEGFNPNAPNAPDIQGSTNIKINVVYHYSFVTTDPSEDDIFYYITWGDGTSENWIGPYPSGETIVINHTWNITKTCSITAKAKDINGYIGPWGTLRIITPRNRDTADIIWFRWFLDRFPILGRLLNLIR